MTSISTIIQQNLSLSLLKQNHRKSLLEILSEDFLLLKIFVFRMNFTLSDYHWHRITKTTKVFKPAFFLATIAWLFIFSLIMIQNDLFINKKFFEQAFNFQSSDLILFLGIYSIFVKECSWLHCTKEVLNYQSRYIDFLLYDLPDYNRNCDNKLKIYLNNCKAIANFIITWIYLSIILLLIIISILVPYWYYLLYKENQINFLQFLFNIPWAFLLAMEVINGIGQSTIPIIFLLICMILFIEKIKRLSIVSASLVHHSYKSLYFDREISWNRFHREYIILYSVIARLNQSAMYIFLDLEFINKSAAMCACVFYSRQDKMNLSNTLFIFMMICSVLSANLVYYQIAKLPTYNAKCIRNLLRWLARSQWSTKFEWKGKRKIFIYKIQQIQWRHSLKSNLFIQTLTNNKFGFTCGHLFFITKYKFIELILLNIPLILMLYKHVYRSTILIN